VIFLKAEIACDSTNEFPIDVKVILTGRAQNPINKIKTITDFP
jgi:hypothetical protein